MLTACTASLGTHGNVYFRQPASVLRRIQGVLYQFAHGSVQALARLRAGRRGWKQYH